MADDRQPDVARPATLRRMRGARWPLAGVLAGGLIAGMTGVAGVAFASHPDNAQSGPVPITSSPVWHDPQPVDGAGGAARGGAPRSAGPDVQSSGDASQSDGSRSGDARGDNAPTVTGPSSPASGGQGGSGGPGGPPGGSGGGSGPGGGATNAPPPGGNGGNTGLPGHGPTPPAGRVTNVPCDAQAASELIAAITQANQTLGATINLARNCTYTLTAFDPVNGDGLPVITQPIVINGNNATITRAALASAQFRIFDVGLGGNLSLQNLTVTGGQAVRGTAPTSTANGGGINVQTGGAIRLAGVTVKNNAAANGGGIANAGFADISGSTVTDNDAATAGGGIYNILGSLTVANTTLSRNRAGTGDGGGLDNLGAAFVQNATVTLNFAGRNGGGISAGPGAISTRAIQSLITDNDAAQNGGGVEAQSSVSLFNSRINGNAATGNGTAGTGNGGGIDVTGGQLVVDNSQVDENQATGNGGGLNTNIGAVLRGSEVSGNNLETANGNGAGINNTVPLGGAGTVSLFATRVIGNTAIGVGTATAGGVASTTPVIDEDGSVIAGNGPTNCGGTVTQPPNLCFG